MSSTWDIRTYQAGDAPAIAAAWTLAAPNDPMTTDRFVKQMLLDRNFDKQGLLVAVQDGRIVGAALGLTRRIAAYGDNLETGHGWIPFFFVAPEARRAGIGRALVTGVLDWLESKEATTTFFSCSTPNYILPGLDKAAYPEADALLTGLGFTTLYEAVAMDRWLGDYIMPESIRARIAALREEGYTIGEATAEDLPDLIELATTSFEPDWGRAIRESYLGGLPPERIMMVRDPDGEALGWAMHGTYEAVIDRFGPFGVVTKRRGTGLGEILLHLTLERMRALGAHNAWFLWTGADSPAGHLYLKTGFRITRTFAVLKRTIDK